MFFVSTLCSMFPTWLSLVTVITHLVPKFPWFYCGCPFVTICQHDHFHCTSFPTWNGVNTYDTNPLTAHSTAALLHCRLFSHSNTPGPLSLLHEVDLCVVGVVSLEFGGQHHTSLAVGSMEATTHTVLLTHSADGLPEPPQVSSDCPFLMMLTGR